ncbi:MAG: dihydrolipoyl dehydrogenase [Deltaproteobacteria bacterium]|nr:dihydrolipoyl dehydrogenase [Deltaproteobacteria bacterium]
MAAADLVIIGAGPGGYVAAIRAAQLGLAVELVEKDAAAGGTCLHVGCIPSKALLESTELLRRIRHEAGEHGLRVPAVDVDLAALMARKGRVVEELARGIGALLKKHRVRVHRGRGRLDGPGRVVVAPPEGPEVLLEARNVLLATGSEPQALPALPFDGDRVVSSSEALSFSAVPPRLAVVGAGAVGLELASVWSRLGAAVVVLELLPRIAPFADEEASRELHRALRRQGLEFRLGATVLGGEGTGDGFRLAVEDDKGRAGELPVDRVLVAVGRRPLTRGLALESAGITPDPHGRIPVDASFRAAGSVYAIGDLVEGPMLAHRAEEEGLAVAELLAGKPGLVNRDALPSVVYTSPELAQVGLTEAQARDAGREVKVGRFPFRASGRARALGDVAGLVKIVADASTDRLLGVHVVGPHASELIAEATLGMEYRAAAEDLARTCHAHPTLSEAIREAAMDVAGRAIHT